MCSVFALLGGNRQSRAPRFPLPVRFQIIRVGDFHQVGGPPEEVFRLDEMVTSNGFHKLAGERFASAEINPIAPVINQSSLMIAPADDPTIT